MLCIARAKMKIPDQDDLKLGTAVVQQLQSDKFVCLFVCLLAWCLTALSAYIGYIVP